MNKIIVLLFVAAMVLTGCSTQADVASRNISLDAEQFKINRRVVFYNGVTNEYILVVEGLCSVEDQMHQLELTCKTGNNSFKKHFLGLSDNVTYFAEQLESAYANPYHYIVLFRPETILPTVDIDTSAGEVSTDQNK